MGTKVKDTPEFALAMASVLFLVCPGIALLNVDVSASWRVLGFVLIAGGSVSWLYWTVKNYRLWKREFGIRRKPGKGHRLEL